MIARNYGELMELVGELTKGDSISVEYNTGWHGDKTETVTGEVVKVTARISYGTPEIKLKMKANGSNYVWSSSKTDSCRPIVGYRWTPPMKKRDGSTVHVRGEPAKTVVRFND